MVIAQASRAHLSSGHKTELAPILCRNFLSLFFTYHSAQLPKHLLTQSILAEYPFVHQTSIFPFITRLQDAGSSQADLLPAHRGSRRASYRARRSCLQPPEHQHSASPSRKQEQPEGSGKRRSERGTGKRCREHGSGRCCSRSLEEAGADQAQPGEDRCLLLGQDRASREAGRAPREAGRVTREADRAPFEADGDPIGAD